MAFHRLRAEFLVLCAALAWSVMPAPALACPFCNPEGKPTLIEDFNTATMVLYGKFNNAKLGAEGAFDGGTTDFVIDTVLKDKEKFLGTKKVLPLPRYVMSKSNWLIFCDIYKGKVDPFRGVELLTNGDIVKYLKGAMSLKDKSIAARLKYCFDYLDNGEMEISMDAYREFAKADYKEYRDLARKLPPDKIAGWLKDPKTPPYRYGLYASLLGHSGNAKHAKQLREMLDDKEKRGTGTGTDGMLVAYTLLDKENGWKYIRAILSNPKEEFQLRYAGLRTIRFFWETRPDVVKKKELTDALCLLLPQTDIADFAIEDLRKWKAWDVAEKVLDLNKQETHNLPVIRRAILRFALSCPPKQGRAIAFVKAERKRDKEYVDDVEELLKLEVEPPAK
jgi:hypothetical protein